MASSPSPLDKQSIKVSCEECSLAELCLPRGLHPEEVEKLEGIVRRGRPIERGSHLFRMSDLDHSMYVVRTGSFKTYLSTDGGDEQVVGFHLPGEILGLDAFEADRHTCSAVALETSSVCQMSGDQLDEVCRTVPSLQEQLQRLIGKKISGDQTMLLLLGKMHAEERLATFLLSLSSRFKERGFSATEFNLSMSRQDIGNYLGLAVETISRLFARFQEEGILEVDRRLVKISDLPRLRANVNHRVGGT